MVSRVKIWGQFCTKGLCLALWCLSVRVSAAVYADVLHFFWSCFIFLPSLLPSVLLIRCGSSHVHVYGARGSRGGGRSIGFSTFDLLSALFLLLIQISWRQCDCHMASCLLIVWAGAPISLFFLSFIIKTCLSGGITCFMISFGTGNRFRGIFRKWTQDCLQAKIIPCGYDW